MTAPGAPQRALVIGEALIDIVERGDRVTTERGHERAKHRAR
ncbi:MAG TPA: hypothetical protein VH166_06490 [Mycobacterium sp.]|nr:hypothetical protein [Mycobacterium sp.]